MAVSGPAVDALRGAPGSARLVLTRWLLAIAAAAPGLLAARGALEGSAGRQPWFADAPDPLPIRQLTALLRDLGPAVPVLAAGVVVAWLAQLLLTAAAVEVFDPRRPSAPVRLWRRTFDTGTRYLWPYLRVTLAALVLLAVGARLVGVVFEALRDRGELAGWSAQTIVFTLPALRLACLVAWAGLVGLLAWWARVIVVSGDRRRIRRVLPMALRAWWRWPVQGVLLHLAVGAATLAVGAGVLGLWRQSPGHGVGWFVAWIGVLLAQAYLWHWRLLTLSLIWGSADLDDVRATPDEPWRVVRRLAARLGRVRRRTAAPPVDSAHDGAASSGATSPEDPPCPGST